LVCHGALSRNPELRILSIENGADWVPDLFKGLKSVYKKMPQAFSEDPIEAFKRCVYITPFWKTGSPRSSRWWAPIGCSSDPTGRTPKA